MKLLAIVMGLCLLSSAGCASHQLTFENSSVRPAADPRARISQDENHNSLVEIEIEHMAQASRLSPPRMVYVVWAEGEEGRILPLGQLRVNEDRLGQFRGVTALDPFRILISAEVDPQAAHPSQPYMLVTDFTLPDRAR